MTHCPAFKWNKMFMKLDLFRAANREYSFYGPKSAGALPPFHLKMAIKPLSEIL